MHEQKSQHYSMLLGIIVCFFRGILQVRRVVHTCSSQCQRNCGPTDLSEALNITNLNKVISKPQCVSNFQFARTINYFNTNWRPRVLHSACNQKLNVNINWLITSTTVILNCRTRGKYTNTATTNHDLIWYKCLQRFNINSILTASNPALSCIQP
jgi:hypothetical protein